jgi:hypothetical protein
MGAKIPLDNEVESLGVWLDPNMTFGHHVDKLCSKLDGTWYTNVSQPNEEKTRLQVQTSCNQCFDFFPI